MNDIDIITRISTGKNEISGKSVNTVCNVLGIMFFVAFLGFVALHCF